MKKLGLRPFRRQEALSLLHLDQAAPLNSSKHLKQTPNDLSGLCPHVHSELLKASAFDARAVDATSVHDNDNPNPCMRLPHSPCSVTVHQLWVMVTFLGTNEHKSHEAVELLSQSMLQPSSWIKWDDLSHNCLIHFKFRSSISSLYIWVSIIYIWWLW